MHRFWRAAASALFTLVATLPAVRAADAPVPIRLGTTTTSGEDQIWLMKARPDLTPGQGKDYSLETVSFRGGDLRFKAFQSGQVDGSVATGVGALTAAIKGVPLRIVAALSEEDNAAYSTPYIVLDKSAIHSAADLKGKTIGLNGLHDSVELGARLALIDAGLDPNRDVNWVVVPPASMGEALRSGKIDVAGISQPFFSAEQAKGGVRVLFTHNSATGFKDEFVLYFNPSFLDKNRTAMRSFIADFVAATHYYIANTHSAREAISKAKLVDMDPSIYLDMVALQRKPDGKPSRDYFEALQKGLLRAGYVDKGIDLDKVVDTSLFSAQ